MTMFRPDPKPPKRQKKAKQALRRTPLRKSVSPTTKGVKLRHALNGGEIRPLWDHFKIMQWFKSQPDVCAVCGGKVGPYNPNRVHHLVPQQNWKLYSIDIINDTGNLIKVGGRFDPCDCHTKIENGAVPKIKKLAEAKKLEYAKYRKK